MSDTEIKKKRCKKLPKNTNSSIQLDLFGQFVSNDRRDISNTIEIWENIPKYFFTTKQQEKLRTSDGLAKPYEWEFKYNGQPCKVVIQPALIKIKSKVSDPKEKPIRYVEKYQAYFPSITEELVEEALKKILTEQQYALHDVDREETWVKFSLSMLQRELKARGRSRSRNEIKHAIQVMNKCNIALFKGKKEIWSGAILQDLVTVARKEYFEDSNSHHIAKLPLFISHSINRLDYNQFNYGRLMLCNEQLARWIYKRLINKFKQASLINNYHFMYQDLKESGLLQQATEDRNRLKVLSALNELIGQGVLMKYKTDKRKEGRKIIDVKYILHPSAEFVREQKAANKRKYNNQTKLENSELIFVDK